MIVHSMRGCRQESGDCQSPFCQPSRQNDGFLAQYKWIRLREESTGNHLPIPGNLGFPHVSTINVPCNQFLARRRALGRPTEVQVGAPPSVRSGGLPAATKPKFVEMWAHVGPKSRWFI